MDLESLVKQYKSATKEGKVADYIPALAEVNPDQLGVAVYNAQTGEVQVAGDSDVRFAIESISKVPTLIRALLQRGSDYVFKYLGMEPSGFAFNSILDIQIHIRNKPANPYINAGAIETVSLLEEKTDAERFPNLLDFYRTIMNDPGITLAEDTYLSEKRTGDVNRSLAYYMRGNGIMEGDVTDILDTYFKQCSVLVTARGLANMGAVLALNGVMPWNGKRLFSKEIAIIVKSLMCTYGTYNEAGMVSLRSGLPTKSGVGGGLLSVKPGEFGIGIFSPPLDAAGNSVAGLKVLHQLSMDQGWDIFS